ncbi:MULTISPECIES: replication/maintenance protein RepL [Campylobacter]|uniref:Replication/maintenance protein RepL n=1 Tax=Campylobacter vicugnae TaxID=1660076 RepID=A0ABZ2E772_9BACT|nr:MULTISPECIES: replication/maintenance protein RepL [Campylobacter]MCR8690636.1 replication/maintenance protein RepL [Campylobacter sp. RM9264]MCR8701455.1 replication/maintenance protein RepL [Campylobacter sp. RM12176]MBQ3167362.1 replication/maintenance protein RepL [Campylobacter sp.]MBQ7134905.1 replication/maintenance protein RepL [Campylobacter sp.]MDL0095932.1 replication/maintenance protein RepL [Campylobacter ovis]
MENINLYKSIMCAIIGAKKSQIIEFIISNLDDDKRFKYTIKELCDELNISKPTAIETINLLLEKRVLKKIKNGLYQLNI